MKLALASALALTAQVAHADPAEILGAEAMHRGGSWTVMVTLRHADTGWEDYADGFRLETPDGRVLATRSLGHPHVDEQPFTRSVSGVSVPDIVSRLRVRARTLTDGWGRDTLVLDLPR